MPLAPAALHDLTAGVASAETMLVEGTVMLEYQLAATASPCLMLRHGLVVQVGTETAFHQGRHGDSVSDMYIFYDFS